MISLKNFILFFLAGPQENYIFAEVQHKLYSILLVFTIIQNPSCSLLNKHQPLFIEICSIQTGVCVQIKTIIAK